MIALAQILGRPRGHHDDPVKVVQETLARTGAIDLTILTASLDAIVEQQLWQRNGQYRDFGEFAVALSPVGLGMRSIGPLRLLRQALLGAGHFSAWTEVLERVTRRRGRPRKKLVNGEDFEPFYTLPTAATARDRILLALKRNHPEQFAAVCELRMSPRAAAMAAGLIPVGHRRYGGACDIAQAAALNDRAQGRLLCELFGAMSANAQCTLIARTLEPHLGYGLAQQWRGQIQPGS